MITPSYGLTATERVLPRMALDFTTAILDPRVTFTRTGNTATVVNSSGFIAGVNADLPRFDFDPITLVCKGLLIEESRTNLFLYSNDFRDTATAGSSRPWSWVNSTVVENATDSPDGTTNASKIEETSATGNHNLAQTITVVNGTTYAYSVYVKPAERDTIDIRFGGSNGSRFNLTTQTVTNVGSGVGSISPAANGFYRCTTIFTSAATSYVMNLYMFKGGISYAGTTGEGLFVYGTQLEAGAFTTSYIPTEATTVTRNADVATMTGTNFSDWFNANEGAFFCEFTSFNANTRSVILLSDNSAANRMYFRYSSGGSLQFTSIISSVNEVTISPSGTSTINTVYQPCAAYKLNSYSYAINGTSRGTDDTANVPTLTQMSIGANFNSTAEFLCGHIRQFNYYPQRLTNAEVVAFSK
jgi:hypothetical protein